MKWVYHITNYATSKYIDNLIKDYVKFLCAHHYKVKLPNIYIRECIHIIDVDDEVSSTGLPYKFGDFIYFMTLNEWESLKRYHIENWKIVNPMPYITWEGKQDTYLTCTEDTCRLNISSSFENPDCPSIKRVIFNDPATVVYWWNGTKTVVKCQDGEPYDPEKGLALCFMKMMLGNKGNYNNVFKEWIRPELSEKNKKEFSSNIVRIKTPSLPIIHTYMQENFLTDHDIAADSGLSIKTVKRALSGCPVLKTTILKICGYFDCPIETTRYVED